MNKSKEEQKLEQVIQKIDPQSRLMRAWELKGGISARMTALEVLLPGGQTKKLIVRRPGERAVKHNPQAAADEFKILQIMQAVGVNAQTPYLLDQSGDIFAEPYLVIEYIEGQPEYAPPKKRHSSLSGMNDVSRCVLQIATQLAKIHRVDSAKFDLSFLPKQAERFARQFRERPAHVDDSLDEGRIREALQSVWPLPQVNEPVLVHGDFWPGNLLWKDGEIVAVIDWEDAELGNPLVDFAISRLDILWTFGIDAMNDFTRHYQSMRMDERHSSLSGMNFDFTTLPYWDLYAALRPASRIAEWAEGWAELGRDDITEETMREGHRWFVEQAFEQIGQS